MFRHKVKHLKVHQKCSTVHHIFNSPVSVSSGDQTLHIILDNYITSTSLAHSTDTLLEKNAVI